MSIASLAPRTVAVQPAQALHVLDDPQEWLSFSRAWAPDPALWESSVVVQGMHCASCALMCEEALARVPGVISAQVSAASHRATVVWSSSRVLPSGWLGALQAAGYRAVPANDCFSLEARKLETRQALWRWLVAGLCMMQVMMYAYPAYIAQPGDLTPEMEQLLRWASWVLTLPVILFSCEPFFKNAVRDVVHRRISMDLPVALGMAITFGVSTVGTFEPHGTFGAEVYFDSLTMFVFFLLTGRWLELRLRDRTAGALEALMNRLPQSAERRLSDGSFERVAARRIVVGDVLRVHAGEAFLADGVVEQGETSVDEALLTGESMPLARGPGSTVIAASHNLSTTVLVRVVRTADATRFAQLVALMQSASTTKPHAAVLADRIAKPFLVFVLLAAFGAAAWWWAHDPSHALMVAVAVLVVTCPCALSLATPAAMLASAGTLARGGVLVRRLAAFETLARVDTFVFDKTGTLTSDAFVLACASLRPGVSRNHALALAAALAQRSVHPVSRALVRAAQSGETTQGGYTDYMDHIEQAPAPQRWTCDSATEVAGQGVSGLVYDACENAPPKTMALRLGSAAFCGVPPVDADSLCVYLSDSHGWLATFELQEELRPQALEVVQTLAQAGVQVHMLSGDSSGAVARVAVQAGISHVQGACMPADKLAYLHQLQAQGRTVAMVGDGFNDAPVLAASHVAFALGSQVPLAQAHADFVVLGSQLTGVLRATLLARRTQRVVRQNLLWALAYNAVCVPLAVMGWLPAWLAGLGMALSSLVVVLNALRLSRH
jgi:P-type Cu2+ transporter